MPICQARSSQAANEVVPRWLTSRSISNSTAALARSDWREATAFAAQRPSFSNMTALGLRTPSVSSLEPALALTRGAFAPPSGLATFGSIGDTAPDTWAAGSCSAPSVASPTARAAQFRTLAESDYLLGVADETRLGALRFRWVGKETFQAPIRAGVPALIELGRLLQITERILRDEETDEDLQLIFAPGSSLGGARPKASVIDQHGHLSIAKFPKETDDYSMETWEEIALRLAGKAGIATPQHELVEVAGKSVMLSPTLRSRWCDPHPVPVRHGDDGARDGERGTIPRSSTP